MHSRIHAVLGSAVAFLLTAGCADQTPVRAYEARGIVREVGPGGESIVLAHEEIADYMPAMVMEFPLGHPDVAKGIKTADEVLFHVVVSASGSPTIVHLEKMDAFQGPFPEFELETLKGDRISTAALDGRLGIINFWASWCAPCREEMPMLVRLQDAFQERGLSIIGIAEDPENLDDIVSQVEELGVHYPVALGDGVLEEALGGVYQIPTTFVVDRAGNVVAKHIGLVSEEELRTTLLDLLSE